MSITFTSASADQEAGVLFGAICKRTKRHPSSVLLSQLTRDEEQQLFSLLRQGSRKARMLLFEMASRNAALECLKYQADFFHEDIVAIAEAKIYELLDKFSEHRDAGFWTYARPAVNHEVQHFVFQDMPLMALPETAVEARQIVEDAIEEWRESYCKANSEAYKEFDIEQQEPSSEYLADVTGLSLKRVREVRYGSKHHDVLEGGWDTLDSDDQRTPRQYVSDSRTDAGFDREDFAADVDSVLSRFPLQKQGIFRALHPLDDTEPMSRKDVAFAYGCTTARIGQIDREILTALSESDAIRNYAA